MFSWHTLRWCVRCWCVWLSEQVCAVKSIQPLKKHMLIHPVSCSVSKCSKNEIIQVHQIWTRETSNWLLQPIVFLLLTVKSDLSCFLHLQISASSNSEAWADFSSFLDACHPPSTLYHFCCLTRHSLQTNDIWEIATHVAALQLVSKWSLLYLIHTSQFNCIVWVYDSECSFIYCAVGCIS